MCIYAGKLQHQQKFSILVAVLSSYLESYQLLFVKLFPTISG